MVFIKHVIEQNKIQGLNISEMKEFYVNTHITEYNFNLLAQNNMKEFKDIQLKGICLKSHQKYHARWRNSSGSSAPPRPPKV